MMTSSNAVKNKGLVIRSAKKEDDQLIFELITKLALYEEIPLEKGGITLDKVRSHGFGNYFDVILAEWDNVSAGFALYFFSYSGAIGAPILYLEDLFVEPHFRTHGIGKALLYKLAKIALEKQCCKMEWRCFKWNEQAIQFYQNLGATPNLESLHYGLTYTQLQILAANNKDTLGETCPTASD